MAETVLSIHEVPIRLTDERWNHIVEEHGELGFFRQAVLDAVESPERVLMGQAGEMFALREIETDRWLVVVYREGADDGFIITAFLTSRKQWWSKRKQIWP